MVSHAGESWSANGLADCQQDTPRQVVLPISTGARQRMACWGQAQVKARFGETFAERALSSRAGERVKLSNKRYCTERMRMPVVSRPICRHSSTRTRLTRSATCDILAVELSCYRSPPGAGTHRMSHLNYNHLYYFG